MITVNQKIENRWRKNTPSKYDEKTHIDKCKVTTVWFLFIPIYRQIIVIQTNL